MDINFILYSLILLAPIIIIAYFATKQKEISWDPKGITIKGDETKIIKWKDIVSVAGASSFYLSGYKLKTNNETITLPLSPSTLSWRKFEKELQKRTNLKLIAESWWPSVLWPKHKRWSNDGKPMEITVWDGLFLYWRPRYLFSRDSLEYFLLLIITLLPWIILLTILSIYY